MNDYNSERSRSTRDAVELAEGFLRSEGTDISIEKFGNKIKTVECRLFSNNIVTIGKGKGIGEQSIASAIFEAIEHRYYHSLISNKKLVKKPVDLNGVDNFLVGGSPDFELFQLDPAVSLSRIVFTDAVSKEEVLFPAVLAHPRFSSDCEIEKGFLARSTLGRYSTNSGVASGTTRDEAILHALLELIERDALGLELLQTIFSRVPSAVRIIRRNGLPANLASLIADVELEAGGRITLMVITSDIGVPSVLAKLALSGDGEVYFGSGASLNPQIAIQRSVLEALQGFHVYAHLMSRPNISELRSDRPSSPYQRCLLEYGVYDYYGAECFVDFMEAFSESVPSMMTVEEQIKSVSSRLQRANVSYYTSDLCCGPVSVVYVIAPRLERFFLVTTGLMVAPGSRGRAVLESPRR
jgi:ribosomal protein S12 methylthiotransferase accessory factor